MIMVLREAIQQIRGFRHMMERLDLCSAVGRRVLYELPWMTSEMQLEEEFGRVRRMRALLREKGRKSELESLACRLMRVRDVRGTVSRLGGDEVLDDLELFELKNFALLTEEIVMIIRDWGIVELPDLEEVVRLLDPDGNRVPHFYVYDAYSPELAEVRARMKRKRQEGVPGPGVEELYCRSVQLEDEVRRRISVRLGVFREVLEAALERTALLDLAFAKAKQAEEMGLCCPVIRKEGGVVFEGLFLPQIAEALSKEGRNFQAVDLRLERGTTLITGANMAGKTVLLKGVELAQHLLQFGFCVPARRAEMLLFDRVLASVGDGQDEQDGLSSFAAEILQVNRMMEWIDRGEAVLVLIDELARTTNPEEGRAIVNGVVEWLSAHGTVAVITTHYGGITAACRKLRVRGLVENLLREGMNLKNIGECMDYSLREEEEREVPHEAVRMARLLGVAPDLLGRVEKYLQEES